MKKLFLVIAVSLILSGCISIRKAPGGGLMICKESIFKKKNKVKKNNNYKIKKPKRYQI